MDGANYPVDPRALLWAELFALAEVERKGGDGRALRLLQRYREAIEPTKARPLHQDDGA